MDQDLLRLLIEEGIPFNKFLGIRCARIEPGVAELELPFRPELVGDAMRPALHGGVLSALADTAGGMAVWSSLDDVAKRVSTIDLRVDYLRPGKLELLVAHATVLRAGGNVGVADIRLYHRGDEAHTVATAKGVYTIKVPKAARSAPSPR